MVSTTLATPDFKTNSVLLIPFRNCEIARRTTEIKLRMNKEIQKSEGKSCRLKLFICNHF